MFRATNAGICKILFMGLRLILETLSLMKRIAARRDTLSRSHRGVAEYVLANPFQAATMGIEDLAAATDVSVATINRFAREFGFAGFVAFRAECLRIYARTLEPVEKMRRLEGGETGALPLMQASLTCARDNLDAARTLLDSDSCTRALDMLVAARRVYVIGFGVSSALARLAQQLLEPSLPVVELIDGSGGSERVIRRMRQVSGPGDLVVAISLQRYSLLTIEMTAKAKAAGAGVLCLTDFPDSPLIPHADAVLLAPSEHIALHASLAGIAALVEALATALTRRCSTPETAVKLTEDLLPYLYTDPQ